MNMASKIEGHFINLRAVNVSDANFIVAIRTDSLIGKYIHHTDNDINKQIEWINQQRIKPNDFYFIIENTKGVPIGVISIYNIDQVKHEGELGRWICKGSLESLESLLLIYDFAFYQIGLERVYTHTVRENVKVVQYHERFGAQRVRENIKDSDPRSSFYLVEQEILKASFAEIKQKNLDVIQRFWEGK